MRTDVTRRGGGFNRAASSLKRLVDGPEPAHVGAGREQDEPQERHAEVGRAAAAAHPRQAANQINGKSGGIHCQWGEEGGVRKSYKHETVIYSSRECQELSDLCSGFTGDCCQSFQPLQNTPEPR